MTDKKLAVALAAPGSWPESTARVNDASPTVHRHLSMRRHWEHSAPFARLIPRHVDERARVLAASIPPIFWDTHRAGAVHSFAGRPARADPPEAYHLDARRKIGFDYLIFLLSTMLRAAESGTFSLEPPSRVKVPVATSTLSTTAIIQRPWVCACSSELG